MGGGFFNVSGTACGGFADIASGCVCVTTGSLGAMMSPVASSTLFVVSSTAVLPTDAVSLMAGVVSAATVVAACDPPCDPSCPTAPDCEEVGGSGV